MLVDTDIGKHRLDNAQPPGIDLFSLRRVYLCFHLVDQVSGLLIDPDGEISARCAWFAQTNGSQRAGLAIFLAGTVNIISAIAVVLIASMTGQRFTVGAEVDLLGCIKREVCRGEGGRFGDLSLPGMNAILETLLVSKTLVSLAKLDIGDISIDVFGFAQRKRIEGMIIAVGGQLFSLEVGIIFPMAITFFFAPESIGARFS